jgi:hypothetical protein
VLLHNAEELDDDLGARSDHDLSLSSLLGVVDRLEAVIEDRCSSHLGGMLEFFRRGIVVEKVLNGVLALKPEECASKRSSGC